MRRQGARIASRFARRIQRQHIHATFGDDGDGCFKDGALGGFAPFRLGLAVGLIDENRLVSSRMFAASHVSSNILAGEQASMLP